MNDEYYTYCLFSHVFFFFPQLHEQSVLGQYLITLFASFDFAAGKFSLSTRYYLDM